MVFLLLVGCDTANTKGDGELDAAEGCQQEVGLPLSEVAATDWDASLTAAWAAFELLNVPAEGIQLVCDDCQDDIRLTEIQLPVMGTADFTGMELTGPAGCTGYHGALGYSELSMVVDGGLVELATRTWVASELDYPVVISNAEDEPNPQWAFRFGYDGSLSYAAKRLDYDVYVWFAESS